MIELSGQYSSGKPGKVNAFISREICSRGYSILCYDFMSNRGDVDIIAMDGVNLVFFINNIISIRNNSGGPGSPKNHMDFDLKINSTAKGAYQFILKNPKLDFTNAYVREIVVICKPKEDITEDKPYDIEIKDVKVPDKYLIKTYG